MNADHVAVGSSDGTVTLLRLARDVMPHYKETSGWTFNKVAQWKNIHGSRYAQPSIYSGDLKNELVWHYVVCLFIYLFILRESKRTFKCQMM